MGLGVTVDVAIGVCAIIILFSVAASAINEFVADTIFRLRGRALAGAIKKLLERDLARDNELAKAQEKFADRGATPPAAVAVPVGEEREPETGNSLLEAFFKDPDIRVLMTGSRRPSAIEGRRYALTVLKLMEDREGLRTVFQERLDAARREAQGAVHAAAAQIGVEKEGNAIAEKIGAGADVLAKFANESVQTIDIAVKRLEGEFNEVMDRVSGWYLRRTKFNLFCIGLFLAVGSNVDVLSYADRMITTEDLSAKVSTVAKFVESEELKLQIDKADFRPGDDASAEGTALYDPEKLGKLDQDIAYAVAQLGDLDVKVGWDCRKNQGEGADLPWFTGHCDEGESLPKPTPSQIIGWILIGFGVTFGAQMWFDLVKRLIGLRTSGITGGVATRPGG